MKMKMKNKTIRLISSILLFPILSIISWAATTQYENMSEENLIAEYSQREQEKENVEKSAEEAEQQKSNNKTEGTAGQNMQDSGSKSNTITNKNTISEKQTSSKNKTTNKINSQNNISSTSTAQVGAGAGAGTGTSQPTQATEQQQTDQSNYETEVVRLCNTARQEAGVTALLNQNSKLQKAADIRATEINQSFSHTRPNGTTAYTVLSEVGLSYTTWGENIAYGQKTPQEVVTAWMNSPGHRANILNANFKEIAVGMKNYYWVQEFI